ncbi:MAG: glycosyltransferase family 39 protein [Alphaproteobacteria bacterium]|nr:glycosyltransferase family 39 protein [Alphaproteobacteria bacterium]
MKIQENNKIDRREILYFISVLILFLYIAMFFISSLVTFDENDFMYGIAPALLDHWTLYRELPFMQAPLSIHVYALVLSLVEPASYYVSLRLVSIAFVAATSVLVYKTVRHLGGRQAAIFSLILFYSSYHLQYISSEIGNYTIALFFVIAATYIYFTKSLNWLNTGLIGLCIGLAGSAKITHGLFAVPFGILLLLRYGVFSNQILSYLIFGLIGSSLIIYYAILDYPSFYFFNLKIHLIINEFREANFAGQLRGIVTATKHVALWFAPNIVIVCIALRLSRDRHQVCTLAELAFLAIAAYAIAMSPKFIFDQYLAPIPAFLCLATPLALSMLAMCKPSSWWRIKAISLLVIVCLTIPYVSMVAAPQVMMAYRGKLAPIEVARVSQEINGIAEQISLKPDCRRSAISLSGIPFFGTPFELLPFGSAGRFLAQLNGMRAKLDVPFDRFADPDSELRRSPPTALLVGYFPQNTVEAAMRAYAVANDYVKFDIAAFGGGGALELFLRPKCVNRE